ncbi:MAG: glycosyltransferase family 4 protein [Bacteroidales bacterium]|nr:glycosyltransferase family 4 protein [Bacteroidales bacterium]
MPMRIGFDAKRAFNNQSGLGNYSRNLLRALKDNYPENRYFLYSAKTNQGIFNTAAHSYIIRKPGKTLHKWFPAYWRTFSMADMILEDKLDIFHGLSHELPFVNLKSVKTVVTVHDLIFLRYPNLYKWADRVIYRKKFEHACRKADRIVAVSRQTAKDIEHFFKIEKEKIEVVYQGCNPAFFENAGESVQNLIRQKYGLPHEYVLYVGTIEERKNLLVLLEAMHTARIEAPLVVIGRKTSYFRKVDEFISRNKIKNILFYDTINNEDLPAIYRMAAVFVYPSLFEGFGIPIIEALASGTPVITTMGGCFEEAGGAGSKYVSPHSATGLADTLKEVLNSDGLRQNMKKAGLEHAGNFTPEKTALNMMEVYQRLLADENRH